MSRTDDSKLAEIINILRQLSEENQRIFIDELHKLYGECPTNDDTSQSELLEKRKDIINKNMRKM